MRTIDNIEILWIVVVLMLFLTERRFHEVKTEGISLDPSALEI